VALAEAAPGGERELKRDARIAEAAKADAFVELEALESDDDALLEPARARAGDGGTRTDFGDFQHSERLRVSFARASWGDRNLAVVCVAGFCANFETGMAWGLLASWGAGRARGRRRAPRRVHGRLLVPQGVLANSGGSRVRPGLAGAGP
jgi:hypothetical protein